MLACQDVAWLQFQGKRFEGHRMPVIQELAAEPEEILPCGDTPDLVEEVRIGAHPQAHVVKVFLDALDVALLGEFGRSHGVKERVDVAQHIAPDRHLHCLTALELPDLREDPRVADGTAANHQTARSRLSEDIQRFRR